MEPYSILKKVAFYLLAVGGLNWGLVGAFEFNLVSYLFGIDTMLARVVYGLVGLSAVFLVTQKCYCSCHDRNHNLNNN